MFTSLEILLLALVLVAVLGASRIIQAVRPLLVNAAVGLLVLFLAHAVLGLEVAVSAITLVIVAIGGVPGAILVILLSMFEVAFVP